jgi:hypothetical protein
MSHYKHHVSATAVQIEVQMDSTDQLRPALITSLLLPLFHIRTLQLWKDPEQVLET